MNAWINKLVELKYKEKSLKKEINEAQNFIVSEAVANNLRGQIANINGAKVTIRLVAVKYEATDKMVRLQGILDERVSELSRLDDEAIYFKELAEEYAAKVAENQASLKARIDELLAVDTEGKNLTELISIEKAQIPIDQVKPQVAVTLPKL